MLKPGFQSGSNMMATLFESGGRVVGSSDESERTEKVVEVGNGGHGTPKIMSI
jgi:hypothetical protein